MSDRVHFKLAYNGETHRFASTLRGNQLYTAVTSRVADIVNKEAYELFWSDEDSNVVLESAADLSTAIEYAMCTRKSASKPPCVLLTAVVETKAADEGQQLQEETAEHTTETSTNLLEQVKQKLRQLFDSALDQQWTADLRSKMQPLITLKSSEDHLANEYSPAEIAVLMDQLEQKVSEELKEQLLQLPRDQLAELLISNWIEDDARERRTSKTEEESKWSDSVSNAAADVRMLIEMNIYQWEDDEEDRDFDGDQDYYEAEEYKKVKEKEEAMKKERDEEEKKEESNWEGKQAAAILKLAQEHKRSVYSELVYSTPEERLQQAEAAAAARQSQPTATTTAATVMAATEVQHRDRAAQIREHLHELANSASEQQKRKARFDISQLSFRLSTAKKEYQTPSMIKSSITALLKRLKQLLPADLQQDLHAMQPEQLSRLLIITWIGDLAEEKQTVPSSEITSAATLEVLLFVAAAASMLPKELEEQIELTYGNHIEECKKKNPVQVEVDIVERQKQEQISARHDLTTELRQFMEYQKVEAFCRRMFPCPWPERTMQPETAHKWAVIIESLGLREELEEYASQLQQLEPSPVHSEITAHLHRYLQKIQLQTLLGLRRDDIFQYQLPSRVSGDWMGLISKERKAKDDLATDPTSNEKESISLEYSPATLVAFLSVCAAGDEWPTVLHRRLIRQNVKKSAVIQAQNADKIPSIGSTDSQQLPPSAWIKQIAAVIMQKGLGRLAYALAQPANPASDESVQSEPVMSEPVIEQNVQSQQTVLQSDEGSEDLIAREREIKIQEKILQLKEEAFERQVAMFQLKIEEYEKKLSKLKDRVEDIEEKDAADYIESRMAEMEERLEKIEEKVDENDIEFL